MSNAHERGRPASWFAVTVITIGFITGGVGLTLGPAWWLFGVGAAITVFGGVLALAVGIMSDIGVEPPRVSASASGTPQVPAQGRGPQASTGTAGDAAAADRPAGAPDEATAG